MFSDPNKRFKMDFLQSLLDDKVRSLVQQLQALQKDNFDTEEAAIKRLMLLRQVNAQVEMLYKQ